MSQVNFLEKIAVDNFAGGGGASTGMELALGRAVEIAINHDIQAIHMHKQNHPFTTHYNESVWDIDPVNVCGGRPVGIAWFSPDCKHFSRAKGGKPVSKNIRGLAWIVLRWAGTVKPDVIMLENVPEFITWGPLRRNKPIKSRKGETFLKWKSQLEALGYTVEYKKLKACDFGAPTIRERLVVIARCDGKPIVWPAPTHAPADSEWVKNGELLPYRTAAECIDFSLPTKSIFGRAKPLAHNTMRRIARGLDIYTIKAKQPFVIATGHTSAKSRAAGINEPLKTIVTKAEHCLVTPSITKFYGGVVGADVQNPLPTVTAIDYNGVVMPYIAQLHFNNVGQNADKPLSTITTANTHILSMPYLTQYHTETSKSEMRGQGLDKPIMTIDTSPRYGIATANLCILRNNMDGADVAEPINTITTSAGHFALQNNFLCEYFSNGRPLSVEAPLHTVTTKDREGLVSVTIQNYAPQTDVGNWPLIRAMLNQHCGYTLADNEIIILRMNGTDYFIADIGFRMLEPRELYNAQGFPPDYKIEFDVNGKPYSKKEQVARCGNAVCPPMAEAVVRANLPDMCYKNKIPTMHELERVIVA